MTKKERRKGYLVALVIAALAAGVALNGEARQAARSGGARLAENDYYSRLEGACHDRCCVASAAEMRRARGTVQPATGCDAGQTATMLRCGTSYRWCQSPEH